MYEITKQDLSRGRKLKAGAIAAPVLLTAAPAAITIALMMLSAGGPPVAFVIFVLGIIATAVGLISGGVIAAVLAKKRSDWTRDMRERIAADGIRADEIGWFTKELRPAEKKALRAVEASDLLLADAYRETLATRLTATRIVRSAKKELSQSRRRQASVQRLQSTNSKAFAEEIARDIEKIGRIEAEARSMLAEAEARLQMIEAAAIRGGSLAGSELALKKLTGRTKELPLALESARMAEEVRRELEQELAEQDGSLKDPQ